MALLESIKCSGALDIELRDRSGRLTLRRQVSNTITTLGKTYIADRLSTQAQAAMSNMAIGTGTPSSTALGTELKRKNFRSNTSSGASWIYVTEYNIDDNFSGTITEAGIFNADSGLGGTMLCSSTFDAITKATNDSLTITWTITIA